MTPCKGWLLGLLADRGVQFILVGGFAALAQGVPLVTFDMVDLKSRSPREKDRLALAQMRAVLAVRDERGED